MNKICSSPLLLTLVARFKDTPTPQVYNLLGIFLIHEWEGSTKGILLTRCYMGGESFTLTMKYLCVVL